MKKFVIDQGSGRLGNQMMQLMVAKRLTEDLPNFEVFGYHMPEWRLSKPVIVGQPYVPLLVRGGAVSPDHVYRLCRSGLATSVMMRSITVDYRRFLSREDANALFRPLPEEDAPGFDDAHIVINIRGEDILFGKSADYGPIPLTYYRSIIEETGKTPVFMGQLFDDYYSNMIRAEFPDAIYVPHTTPIRDFQIIRNSQNIVVSLSTFSWLAAWMSDAKRIYMPLIGGWNPEQRPDGNLTPADDPRFVYDLFPIRKWKATPEQIAGLTTESDFRRVTVAEIDALRDRASGKLLPKRLRKTTQLYLYLLMHLAGRAFD
ncbi:hypothetical protein [Pleomorphomonas sp. NRK KF1]|uniref:hypothetical protein n=1 Tax=Pleomorphomonas sp. NRK KF1 TaxID=2943000 RepID=UPI002042BDC4|nr:hypothetical protein [Pleomorphomonas sp. NRK KF1]MCM5555066.1 hypothetical protein [Pleomorphomonas sp. NRK KF1]